MKLLLIGSAALVFAAAAIAQAPEPVAHYGHHGPALLPDPKVTPGRVRSSSVEEVCHGGSTKQFRHTTAAEKANTYKQYGATKVKDKCCEVDHLISLELGGADDPANLWPQPYEPRPGAHEKDAVENWLHVQVCAGKISLAEAQAKIATDWYDVYLKMQATGPPASRVQ